MAGHADRGHWRREEASYLADGYLREADAKASGLVPPSWSRSTPDPVAEQRHGARIRLAAWLFGLAVVVVLMLLFLLR